jgi:hypothetical protein
MPIKVNSNKPKIAESEQAIDFLTKISAMLKLQHRHFDDAVVTHSIRLIKDYLEDKQIEVSPRSSVVIAPRV